MRIDKYITDCGVASRRECLKAARQGMILVNGVAVRDVSVHIDEENAQVIYCGRLLRWRRYVYIMLNKPAGYISSTEVSPRCIMNLLPPEYRKMDMFPCGRLDVDTVGLLLVTNDGPLAHKLLSPTHHAEKKYFFQTDTPLSDEDISRLQGGVDIGDYVTRECSVECEDDGYLITLTEGKFHQIKRMLEAVGNRVTYLKRISFGNVELDPALKEGQWRELSAAETDCLRQTR